jgi:hypothetical protein
MMPFPVPLFVPSNGASIIPLSTSPVTDQALSHVGAQFYAGTEISRMTVIPKASGSAAASQKAKSMASHNTVLDKYLQSANRAEILCLGIQSPRSDRAFHNRLIAMIDGLLLQIAATVTQEGQPANS